MILSKFKKIKLIDFLKKNQILIILLLFGLLTFLYTYWTNVYRPGSLYQNGWYTAWADQKRYYSQAQAISQLQLNVDTFYYPILYPLLGSFLIRLIPSDPFFLVNISLFLTTVGLLYVLVDKVFGKEKAIFSVILLLISNRFVYDFVTPWTTNITTPLFLGAFFILYTNRFSLKNLIIISILTGVVFLSRYTDIVFFLPLLIAFIFKDNKLVFKNKVKSVLASSLVLLFFALVFFSFNLVTSKNLLGPYILRVTSKFNVDLAPVTIFEKTVGFFIDSFTFHRQIEFFGTPALTTFPTLIFIIFYFCLILFQWHKNSINIKVINASMIISAALWYISYIPYGAISPYTLKNLALHYIKPWFPISIFFTVLFFDKLLKVKREDYSLLKIFFTFVTMLIIIPLLIYKFQPKVLTKKDWFIQASINNSQAKNIIDEHVDRSWSSERPRKRGDNIIIDLKKIYRVSRLRLIDQPPFAATNFDTLLSMDGKVWQSLARNYTYNVRREYGWDLVGYMKKARYIKLVLNEESQTDAWQIKEIEAYGY